jgi:hypothetical protein
MAHYAYLDKNNIVVAVIVGKDENELIDGLDTETYYAQGTDYTVKRTSYNGKIRYNFAGIGYKYIKGDDAFVSQKPQCGHEELILNKDVYRWECTNQEHEIETLAE